MCKATQFDLVSGYGFVLIPVFFALVEGRKDKRNKRCSILTDQRNNPVIVPEIQCSFSNLQNMKSIKSINPSIHLSTNNPTDLTLIHIHPSVDQSVIQSNAHIWDDSATCRAGWHRVNIDHAYEFTREGHKRCYINIQTHALHLSNARHITSLFHIFQFKIEHLWSHCIQYDCNTNTSDLS